MRRSCQRHRLTAVSADVQDFLDLYFLGCKVRAGSPVVVSRFCGSAAICGSAVMIFVHMISLVSTKARRQGGIIAAPYSSSCQQTLI